MTTMLLSVGLALLAVAQAQYPPVPVVKIAGALNFAAIGDWGRVGGIKSTTPASQGGFDLTGSCTANFAATVVDAAGAIAQVSTAKVMESAIKSQSAKFVVNTGDNFYECGIDSPMRVISDWAAVYQGPSHPKTSPLTWYTVIGNHDIPYNSTALQLDFAKVEPRWYFPSRYYAVDYVSTGTSSTPGTSVRIVYINTNPFVTSYAKSNNKYYGPEMAMTTTPAAISAQLQYIEWALNTSTADWDIVVGHHPIASSANGINGFNVTNPGPGVTVDLGRPDLTGTGSFAQVLSMLRKYNVSLYFNGHNHVLTHASDPMYPNGTQFVTTGAGSFPDPNDHCNAAAPWVKYVANPKSLIPQDCTASTTAIGTAGFNIVKATPTSLTVKYYGVPQYNVSSGKNMYSFKIQMM